MLHCFRDKLTPGFYEIDEKLLQVYFFQLPVKTDENDLFTGAPGATNHFRY